MPEIHRVGVGGDGRLMVSVYLRSHKDGKCYYARFKVTNKKSAANQRYVTESLQTADLTYALEKARTRYAEISLLEKQGKSIKADTVANEVDRFIEEYETSLNQGLAAYSTHMLRSHRKTTVRYWREYVGKIPMSSISWDHMNEYERWRQTYLSEQKIRGKKIHGNAKEIVSTRTIETEINNFKFFLRWAAARGKYSGTALEYVYKNREGDVKRSAFTTSQWTKLTAFMRRKTWLEVGRRGNDSRLIRHRRMLKAYVLFMKNTGLRVGEARHLRWGDVEFVHAEDEMKRLVRVKVIRERSKTRKGSVVIGNEGAYNALRNWYELRLEAENWCESDSPIWCDPEGNVVNDFREGFNNLIKDAGVELDASGNKLTIYSLRHTYITEQLKSGVSVYQVSLNCNTSVAMIERYYSDARTQDFEAALTSGYRKNSRDDGRKSKVV
jgi:integrase